MGQHQRTLQFGQVFGRDLGGGQQAETGVDAVGSAAFGDDFLDAGHGCVNGLARTGVQLQLYRLFIGQAQVGEAQLAGVDMQVCHVLSLGAPMERPVDSSAGSFRT
ncbi:hypothetical protein D3C72_1267450 [compost metagenome]